MARRRSRESFEATWAQTPASGVSPITSTARGFSRPDRSSSGNLLRDGELRTRRQPAAALFVIASHCDTSTRAAEPSCGQALQKKEKRDAAEDTPHGMKASPANQQVRRSLTARIESWIEQLRIGWKNRNERERHHAAQENRAQGQPGIPLQPCRPQTGRATRQRKRYLHHRRSVIARREFPNGQLRATRKARRMFNCVDVDRRTCEESRAKRR